MTRLEKELLYSLRDKSMGGKTSEELMWFIGVPDRCVDDTNPVRVISGALTSLKKRGLVDHDGGRPAKWFRVSGVGER